MDVTHGMWSVLESVLSSIALRSLAEDGEGLAKRRTKSQMLNLRGGELVHTARLVEKLDPAYDFREDKGN